MASEYSTVLVLVQYPMVWEELQVEVLLLLLKWMNNAIVRNYRIRLLLTRT